MSTNLPIPVKAYHCICTTLLLTTTHTLSSLPRRTPATQSDSAIILPLPSTPPPSTSTSPNAESPLPPSGYTQLLNLTPDTSSLTPPTIIRRADGGFEKRVLYRCARCRVVVGYEIVGVEEDVDMEDGGQTGENYRGKVLYILPGGVMSTEFMTGMSGEEGKKIREADVGIGGRGIAVFE